MSIYKIAFAAFVFVIVYFQVFVSLVKAWIRTPEFSHGFLIPLVSAFIVFHRRNKLKSVNLRPNVWGILVLAFGLLMYIFGMLGKIEIAFQFSLIVSIGGLILLFGGRELTLQLLFPVGFLIFMIPIPESIEVLITGPMKLFATKSAVGISQAMGIPVLREGNIIHLSGLSLFVQDACSGLRSVISLLPLGIIFAYFTKRSRSKRLLIVAITIPIALIANILRIWLTILGSIYFGEKLAMGYFHEFSGLSIFVFAFVCLIIFGRSLDWILRERSTI
jgi:exosortase